VACTLSNLAQYFLMYFLGLQTAMTPCYLPVFPVFLALSSRRGARQWLTGLFFSLGVIMSFVVYGFLLVLGGGVVRALLMGLNQQFVGISLGIVLISLGVSLFTPLRELFSMLPQATPTRKISGTIDTVLFGLFFSLAAAPCAAALMTAVLSQVLLSSLTGLFEPLLLMSAYGAGVATPFAFLGLLGEALRPVAAKSLGAFLMRHSESISGALLVVIGFLSISSIENFDVILPVASRSLLPWVEVFLALAVLYYSYSLLKMGFYLEAPEIVLAGCGFVLVSIRFACLRLLQFSPETLLCERIAFLSEILSRVFLLVGLSHLLSKSLFLEVLPLGIYLNRVMDFTLFAVMLVLSRRDSQSRFLVPLFLYMLLGNFAAMLPDHFYVFYVFLAIISSLGVVLAGVKLSLKHTILKLYQEI